MKRKRRGRIGHVIPLQTMEFHLIIYVLLCKRKYILPLA